MVIVLILQDVRRIFGNAFDKAFDEIGLGAVLFLVAKEARLTGRTIDTDSLKRVHAALFARWLS